MATWSLTRLVAAVGVAAGFIGALLVPTAAPAASTAESSVPAATYSLANFSTDGYQPFDVAEADWPYNDVVAKDRHPFAVAGVPMVKIKNKYYNHPVMQATFGLRNLAKHHANQDPQALARAVAVGQRAIDSHVVSRGAWWFPYLFKFSLHKRTSQPPWFSAMAQGQTLSLFTRLYEETRDPKWRDAAAMTFASLTLPPDPKLPWCSWVDRNGFLWLEEYPRQPTGASERVLNGSIFAAFGVYDYWRISRDVAATRIFDGAATTARYYAANVLRVPGGNSRYSVSQRRQNAGYHRTHIRQFVWLHALTRDSAFAKIADALASDFPPTLRHGTVTVAKGRYVAAKIGWSFDARKAHYLGPPVGKKLKPQAHFVISKAGSVAIDARVSVQGKGRYVRLAWGSHAGRWLKEQPGRVSVDGFILTLNYRLGRALDAPAGDYVGSSIAAGAVSSTSTVNLAAPQTLTVVASGELNGAAVVKIAGGILDGLWISTPAVTGLR